MLNMYKSYALCVNNSKINITTDATVLKLDCEIFNTLKEAINQKDIDKPLDFRILKVYCPKPQTFYKTNIELQVTYILEEDT